MAPDLVSAKYLGAHRLAVVFADGRGGEVDLAPFLAQGGVFARLRDEANCRQFRINRELGVLEWPGGADIAPETLYAAATGTPLPAWMEVDVARHASEAAPPRR